MPENGVCGMLTKPFGISSVPSLLVCVGAAAARSLCTAYCSPRVLLARSWDENSLIRFGGQLLIKLSSSRLGTSSVGQRAASLVGTTAAGRSWSLGGFEALAPLRRAHCGTDILYNSTSILACAVHAAHLGPINTCLQRSEMVAQMW